MTWGKLLLGRQVLSFPNLESVLECGEHGKGDAGHGKESADEQSLSLGGK
jgi:hypothetical protein